MVRRPHSFPKSPPHMRLRWKAIRGGPTRCLRLDVYVRIGDSVVATCYGAKHDLEAAVRQARNFVAAQTGRRYPYGVSTTIAMLLERGIAQS